MAWAPGQEYPLILDDGLLGGDTCPQQLWTMRYDFVPASLASQGEGALHVNIRTCTASVSLPRVGSTETLRFQGKYEESRDGLDCAAVFDGSAFRLHLVGASLKTLRHIPSGSRAPGQASLQGGTPTKTTGLPAAGGLPSSSTPPKSANRSPAQQLQPSPARARRSTAPLDDAAGDDMMDDLMEDLEAELMSELTEPSREVAAACSSLDSTLGTAGVHAASPLAAEGGQASVELISPAPPTLGQATEARTGKPGSWTAAAAATTVRSLPVAPTPPKRQRLTTPPPPAVLAELSELDREFFGSLSAEEDGTSDEDIDGGGDGDAPRDDPDVPAPGPGQATPAPADMSDGEEEI